jgi:DNA-directed RNA polymerase specialized sigma subunit
MSIKLLARDLYRLQQQIERLEKELTQAPADRHGEIAAALRSLRAEWMNLRRALDGQIGR